MVNYEDISATAVVRAANIGDVVEGTVLAVDDTNGEVFPGIDTDVITGFAYSEPINGIVAIKRFGIIRVKDDGTGTYTLGQPVKASATVAGAVMPWTNVDAVEKIIGKVEAKPDTNGYMEIRVGGV